MAYDVDVTSGMSWHKYMVVISKWWLMISTWPFGHENFGTSCLSLGFPIFGHPCRPKEVGLRAWNLRNLQTRGLAGVDGSSWGRSARGKALNDQLQKCRFYTCSPPPSTPEQPSGWKKVLVSQAEPARNFWDPPLIPDIYIYIYRSTHIIYIYINI